ncbi:MAG: 50S ribosomal protein L32 [Bacillota bacterium]|nr:50S ribosomal protein L32 [Bacillota bacterium]
MANPKNRWSKARTRSHKANWKAEAPAMIQCQCGEYRMPHRVCPNCGQYKKRTVVDTDK